MSLFCTFRYGYWRISRNHPVFQGSSQSLGSAGCVFHLLPDPGGGIRILHSLSRLLPDHLAAAACAGRAAGRYDRMAARRCPDPYLQRAAGRGPLHGARRAESWIGRPTSCTSTSWMTAAARSLREFAFEAGIGYKIAPRQQACQGRQHQHRAQEHDCAVCGDLRLRSRADAQLSADDHGLVPARPEAGHAADAAPLLFARSVRAQPGTVPRHSQRGRAVLRHCAGRQRFLERDLLLRLLRGAAAQGAR